MVQKRRAPARSCFTSAMCGQDGLRFLRQPRNAYSPFARRNTGKDDLQALWRSMVVGDQCDLTTLAHFVKRLYESLARESTNYKLTQPRPPATFYLAREFAGAWLVFRSPMYLVDPSLWNDPEFRALDPEDKYRVFEAETCYGELTKFHSYFKKKDQSEPSN